MIQQIIIPPTPKRGDIIKLCTGAVCMSYKILRVRGTRESGCTTLELIEAAGSLAADPMIIYYDERRRKGDIPKVARAKACWKFKLQRRQFFNRLASR